MRTDTRHRADGCGRSGGQGRAGGRGRGSERGQAFALEAVVASLVLLGGLVFALQATAVTPLSASTSSQHIENQQAATAEGVLATAADDGSLRVAVLNWNDTADRFYGVDTDQAYYTNTAPENGLGTLLSRAFDDRGIVFNVYVHYATDRDDDGEVDARRTQRMVYRGEPTDNAAAASRVVTLFDDDVLYDDSESPTGPTVSGSVFYAEDVTDTASSNTAVYNVVTVEVVVWRQ
jgi:hypothetical protein